MWSAGAGWRHDPMAPADLADRMKGLHVLLAAVVATTGIAHAWAQQKADVTVVLQEELDLVEPCMATRSNIGRIIMENVSETLTQYDVRNGQGVIPRLAASWMDQGLSLIHI